MKPELPFELHVEGTSELRSNILKMIFIELYHSSRDVHYFRSMGYHISWINDSNLPRALELQYQFLRSIRNNNWYIRSVFNIKWFLCKEIKYIYLTFLFKTWDIHFIFSKTCLNRQKGCPSSIFFFFDDCLNVKFLRRWNFWPSVGSSYFCLNSSTTENFLVALQLWYVDVLTWSY